MQLHHARRLTPALGLIFTGVALGQAGGAKPLAARPGSRLKQPAAATAQAPALSLAALVRLALARNPEIAAYAGRAAALRARVRPSEALPDPTVSLGWMGKPLPFALEDNAATSYRQITATQRFPFPGKLKLQGQVAEHTSRAAGWDYQAARRRVRADVKTAYYQYAYFYQALRIVENTRALLQRLTQIAETRYESGQGLQEDVLKGQVELSQLLERVTILRQEQRTAAARINTLLNRSPETPLGAPAPPAMKTLPYTLHQLYQLARAHDTGLEREQQLIARDQSALALAHKSYDPDFSVSYMYQRSAAPMNMQGAFVTLNIPIFYRAKQRQEVLAASRMLTSDRDFQSNRGTTVNYLVKQQYLALRQAAQLAVLYSQAIVPQSTQTLNASITAYESGKVDFLTMLDNFINLLDFQVKYDRQKANYEIALARLEPLVGVELTR